MAKKFIHIVEHLQYSNLKDEYIKHDFECFSSYKKAVAYVENVLLVNKAIDTVRDDFEGMFDIYEKWDYKHMNCDNQLMELRLVLRGKELK
jgi:hypothetical protein